MKSHEKSRISGRNGTLLASRCCVELRDLQGQVVASARPRGTSVTWALRAAARGENGLEEALEAP